jgi:hypothetical protein
MKYAMRLSFLALLTTAVVATAASSASATILTVPSGNNPGPGIVIKAQNVGETVLDGPVNVKCKKSNIEATVLNAGGPTETVVAPITSLTFTECGANTVNVVDFGSLEVHTDSATADGNGTLTSSGAEITVLTHNILGTVHCIYATESTDVGTLDGSKNTGGKATLTVDSVPIPRVSTDFGCGSTSEWTAEYTVNTPEYLDVD